MKYSILLLLASLYLTKGQDASLYPAIAMKCGKNTQHRDVKSGDWITDSSGNKDCMDDPAEMLEYCRQVYPDLEITSIARQTVPVLIRTWCALGHRGPTCKGHRHSVNPVKCITADHTPTLVAKTGCNIVTISDDTLCKGSSYWAAKAAERCQDENKILNDQRNNVMPCNGLNKWRGIQFACCENKKPVPKFMNIDPVCTEPKKSGVCRAAFDAWYFSLETGSCTHFTYGGCGGNNNRFTSLKDCQDKCESTNLISDPLLGLELGPVIPEDSSTTTTNPTSTSTSTVMDDRSIDSYFDAPLDPNSEHEMYSNAMMDELKEHQNKLSSLMEQWNSAKSDLLRQGASSDKGDLVDSDLEKEMAALRNEHERKREQLNSAHHARMDASIVGSRTSAYNDLTNELSKPDVQPSKVLRAFRRYVQSESRDQHHTNKLLQHALDQDSDEADALNGRLSTIKSRVNNALASAQLRLGPGETSDKLDEMVSSLLSTTPETPTTAGVPEILHDSVIDDMDAPSESERPRLIDYGGLPPENVDNREEIDDYGHDHDSEDDKVFDDDEMTGNSWDDEDDAARPDLDEDFFPETPVPLNPMDFSIPAINDFDSSDDYHDIIDDPMPDGVQQWDEESYDEQNWLIWVGVGGSCLLLLVLMVAVGHRMGTRYGHRRQFARVEVEEQLTPEERQLLQMQQNGYENPTYKFFEKQQQRA